ncbi:MAG: transposon-transfer assisting family protein [Acutalibacteraceae bacterium]|nr:transposon-transfer assisting family protein [Acutalibacteraceae bacterium]
MKLTFEENNIVALYSGETREETIGKIEEMMQYLETDEAELRLLSEGAVTKLRNMSDDEYSELDLFPEC